MEQRVLIVGAGMAGLAAATALRRAGYSSVLLDKSRAVGGRMSTKTIGRAQFDQGAQHFAVRSDEVAALLQPVIEAGVMREWYQTASGEPRYVGTGGMRRIPEFLAEGMDVRIASPVDLIEVGTDRVTLVAGNTRVEGSAAIVTPPVPQTAALLDRSGIDPPPGAIPPAEYRACLAVMAELDGPAGLPEGHLTVDGAGISWLADNYHKGTSVVPSLTIHSTPAFAAQHLEEDPDVWIGLLVEAAGPLIGSRVTNAVGHRWRFAEPATTATTGAPVLSEAPPVLLAGEIFAGAKVEGAVLSGLAAAQAVIDRLG